MFATDLYRARWLQLFPEADNNTCLSRAFDDLLAQYSQPHRAYHTLTHIVECLKWFDHIRGELDNAVEVELALWFHDVIYNPKQKDNEARSADYAGTVLQSTLLAKESVDRVTHLILLTQHPSIPRTRDEQYLLDIDLAILGASETIYTEYEHNIRLEYCHVPWLLYRLGRKKLLNKFLNSERLYHTEYFYNALEAQARSNLARALLHL